MKSTLARLGTGLLGGMAIVGAFAAPAFAYYGAPTSTGYPTYIPQYPYPTYAPNTVCDGRYDPNCLMEEDNYLVGTSLQYNPYNYLGYNWNQNNGYNDGGYYTNPPYPDYGCEARSGYACPDTMNYGYDNNYNDNNNQNYNYYNPVTGQYSYAYSYAYSY